MCSAESIGFRFTRQTKKGNGAANPNYCPKGSLDRAPSVIKRKKGAKRTIVVIR